jgi:hypothetical protein
MSMLIIRPLAITSVCESETRLRRGGTMLPPTAPLIGMLFGPITTNTNISGEYTVTSICDAVEAIYSFDIPSQRTLLNLPKMVERKTLWTTVYPSHELVGWYSIGHHIEPWQIQIHKEITDSLLFQRNPVFLLMNSAPDPNAKVLPLAIYTLTEEDHFTPLTFQLEAQQAETIALDQIIKSVPANGKNSSTIKYRYTCAIQVTEP